MVLQSLFLAGWKLVLLNPIAPKMAKTRWSFGHSECNRVKVKDMLSGEATLSFSYLLSLSKGSPLKKNPPPQRVDTILEGLCSTGKQQ